MKTIMLTLATLAMLSGSAMAASNYDAVTSCSPIKGNWVNAATQNCQSIADNDEMPNRTNDYVRPEPPARECDPKSAEAQRS